MSRATTMQDTRADAPAAADEGKRKAVALMQKATRHDRNASYATTAVCERYLAARDGSLPKATAMLRASLAWRAAFGVDDGALDARWEHFTTTGASGKVRVSPSRDRAGRPVMVLTPRLERTRADHDGNISHLVYELERLHGARELEAHAAPPRSPDGKAVIIVDFRGWSMGNQPPLRTQRTTLSILQDHYPERLHMFVALHAPALFYGAYRVIRPFIDPKTRAKIRFVHGPNAAKELEEIFDLSELETSLGGTLEYEFDAEAYFDADVSHKQWRAGQSPSAQAGGPTAETPGSLVDESQCAIC